MEIAWAIGAGVGLSTLAGVRAFLPLAVFMLVVRLDWMWWFEITGTPFDFLHSSTAVTVLLVLVIVEVVLTRVSSLAFLERQLRLPASVVSGALLAAAAAAAEVPGYYAGLAVGALLALLGVYVHRGLLTAGGGKDLGPALDFSILVLSFLVMLVPPAGYLVALFFIYLGLRVRRMRRLKYKGLRVLA